MQLNKLFFLYLLVFCSSSLFGNLLKHYTFPEKTSKYFGRFNKELVTNFDKVNVIYYGRFLPQSSRVFLTNHILKEHGFKNITISCVIDRTDTLIWFDSLYWVKNYDPKKMFKKFEQYKLNKSQLTIGIISGHGFPMSGENNILGLTKNRVCFVINTIDDYQFKNTLIHEILHSVGVIHCDQQGCIMNSLVYPSQENFFCEGHQLIYNKTFKFK